MIYLKDILYKVSIEGVKGDTRVPVEAVEFNSQRVVPGAVFVAIRGTNSDGHQYIESAIQNGAKIIVCEEWPEVIRDDVSYIMVQDTKEALALMASNYYGNPSENLKLTGVTGTNGKTTIASLLYRIFTKAGYKVGLISTIVIRVGDKEFPSKLTTPDSLTINKYLKMMNDEGVEYCFMEVSSHGIAQKRTAGLQFVGGIFTNLSHDHLDYHKTFAEYRNVKKSFFDHLPKNAFALTNSDDKNGAFMLQNTKAHKKSYAMKSVADYKVKVLEDGFQGMLLNIDGHELWVRLIGNFNAYNLLAIYATADLLGLEKDENLKYISELESVEGRFEYFVSPKELITAVVDYAHSPDALMNVLKTINSIRTKNEKLITVVGCGGDRDREKRPVMGRLAAELSDKVIYTSDNPRTEDPMEIIREIEAGVGMENRRKTISIVDREQAIKTACIMAENRDIILIAGKGHETYQEINGVRHHFDDMEKVSQFLKEMDK